METIMEFEGVSHNYKGLRGEVVAALRGVSFSIGSGEVLALVGESGSGKTTLGRLSVGLMRASSGRILFRGENVDGMKTGELWSKTQYIHQDPYSALDPYLTVEELLDRPLRYVKKVKERAERRRLASASLEATGLDRGYLAKKIGNLSGGERQRVLLVRAFVIEPAFVVADEPTSMVDAVHRNEIIGALTNLRTEVGSSLMVITHDLSVASQMADNVAIMYKGEVVEFGPNDLVTRDPLHPYSQALLAVTPQMLLEVGTVELPRVTSWAEEVPLVGPRCRYSSHCPYVFDRCRTEAPKLKKVEPARDVACFKYQ
jgi:peptide/nickel transport system ATP-binding protein